MPVIRQDGGQTMNDMTRRGFLGVTGAAGSAAMVGVQAASRPGESPGRRNEMALQVARIVAVFPVPLPFAGGEEAALSQATAARLGAAAASLPAGYLAAAHAGADQLIADGLLGASGPDLLGAMGDHAELAAYRPGLTGLVTLAVATVSDYLRPRAGEVAQAWADGLRARARRGALGSFPARLEA
jgi:hypothetical protein